MKKRISIIIAVTMILTLTAPAVGAADVPAPDSEITASEESQTGEEAEISDDAGSESTDGTNADIDNTEEAASDVSADSESDTADAADDTEKHPETEQDGAENRKFEADRKDYLSYDPLYIARYADPRYVDVSEIEMVSFYDIAATARGVATYNVSKQSDFRITESNYIAGLTYQMPVYDVDKSSGYYLAVPDVNKFNNEFREYDLILAYNNDYGEVISGSVYKDGILYIPKKAIDDPGNTHDVPENIPVAVQINYAAGGDMDFSKKVPVQILNGTEPADMNVTVSNIFVSDSLNVSTGVKGRKESDVSVYLNGSMIPANTEGWHYDKSTGTVSVSTCPGVISNVNIVFRQRDIKEKLSDMATSFIDSVTPDAFAAGKVSMDDMKFFKTKSGKEVTLDIPTEKLFVGWRGYYTGKRVHGKTTDSSTYAKLMACNGWEDSIQYMYGGFDSQDYVDGSDEYIAKHMAATWAFTSYASAYNVDPDSSGGSIDKASELIKYWNNKTKKEESKTIYEWLLLYRDDLELSKNNTGVNDNGTMANNGLGGVNNFAFTLPKRLTGASTSLVSGGDDANRKNASFTVKSDALEAASGDGETANYYDYWICASCNHLDKAEADEGDSKKTIYATCLGLGSDYAVLAFVQAGASGSQNACGVYKFRLAPSGYVKLVKSSALKEITSDITGNYTLAGAVYKLFTDKACTAEAYDVDGREAALKTKADGSTNTLEMAPGTYYVKEVTASKGYETDTNVNGGKPVVISSDNTEDEPYVISSSERPAYGMFNVIMNKQSSDYGYKRLLGAEYTLKYYDADPASSDVSGLQPKNTWVFKVVEGELDGGLKTAVIDFANDEPVSGGSMYRDGANVIMPAGVFTLKETKAPRGLAIDPVTYMGTVKQEKNGGKAVISIEGSDSLTVDYTDRFRLINSEPKRSVKLALHKKDAETGKSEPQGTDREYSKGSLAGAVYEVYMEDNLLLSDPKVGEIITDEEGYGELSTDSHNNGEPLDPGTYYIKEKTASAGYVTDSSTTEEEKDKFENGMHVVHARVDDTSETIVFEYTVDSMEHPHHTIIHKTDITDGKELAGAELQVIDSDGKIADQWISGDEPHDIVALPDGNYTLREITAPYGYDICEDVSFEVKEDTVTNEVFMKNKPVYIGTVAQDTETGGHAGSFRSGEKIRDTVKITGLYPDRKYRVEGTLMDRESGNALSDRDGKEITAELDFTADSEEMTLELEFEVDSSDFTRDTSIVVFEKLYRTEKVHEGSDEELPAEISRHEDINDEGQTIHYGGIASTSAAGGDTQGRNILAGRDVSIIDTVTYNNLSPEEEYTLKGELYDKTTGELLGISTVKKFIPGSPDGTIEVSFSLNAEELKNHRIVVYETLYTSGIVLDEHRDPEDEEQTVRVPEIRTMAADPGTGEDISNASDKMTIKDTVYYSNLEPGRKYKIRGTLNYRGKLPGRTYRLSEGDKQVTASAEFTPSDTSGEETVVFTFNGNDLKGKTLVVFEELLDGDTVIAEHQSINDEKQSVHIPEIGTEIGRRDGDHVTDTVRYKNLVPGKTYRVKGYFVRKSDGKRIEGSDGVKTFTPEKASGKVEVKLMPVESEGDLVAFESVYVIRTPDENGGEDREILIGEHKDINDKAQTYSKYRSPKTGDDNILTVYMMIVLAAAAGIALIIRRYISV